MLKNLHKLFKILITFVLCGIYYLFTLFAFNNFLTFFPIVPIVSMLILQIILIIASQAVDIYQKNKIIELFQFEQVDQEKSLIKQFSITEREEEIINLLKEGFKYNQIAKKLFISLNTVKAHIRNIYEKTQTKSRLGLINALTNETTKSVNNKTEESLDAFFLKNEVTSKEKEVIVLIKEGFTNLKIAEKMSISVNTVKSHVSNVFEKIGVSSRMELIEKINKF